MKIGGSYIYYYFICPRKLWFFSRKITMEHTSELVEIGKYIELFYKEQHKYEKKVIIEDISPDVIKRYKDLVLVFEIKKSSKIKQATEWQLKYYLWYFKKNLNINAKGKLIIPEEGIKEEIELKEEDEIKLKEIINDIKEIIAKNEPPKVPKKSYCKFCSYKYLCFDDF
ncbi:MAG: CRISPR-associated protein Cas4 [Candidatus Aenigmatarchaeota archaeon]